MAGPAQESAENAGRGFRFTGQTQRSGIDWSPATPNGASTAPLPRPVTPPGFQPGNGPGVTTQISPTAPAAAESKRRWPPAGWTG